MDLESKFFQVSALTTILWYSEVQWANAQNRSVQVAALHD